MLRDIKSKVQENSSMLKKLLKDNTVSEAPSSTSLPTKKFKPNLNLPLRTFEDVDRTERELKNATARKKYVSQYSVYNNLKGYYDQYHKINITGNVPKTFIFNNDRLTVQCPTCCMTIYQTKRNKILIGVKMFIILLS